jgi:hypothetical protein
MHTMFCSKLIHTAEYCVKCISYMASDEMKTVTVIAVHIKPVCGVASICGWLQL